jgi:geranylgeranyl reductase family protein
VTAYDAIVVGAGPAGSTAARLLAQRGARVLLLDRAPFPRDKPCGGGVTLAAANELDIDISPVTERTITEVRVSYRLGKPFTRTWPEPLTYMTQRCRLDAFLAERAVAAGAEFRDGLPVRDVELGATDVTVRANGDAYRARTLIGADGANGIVARALGLTPIDASFIALEGNIPAGGALTERWRNTVAVDLGGTPGGYGWLFPKGEHLNVGVGGWRWIGPTLRARLTALCAHLGLDETQIFGLGGYHLPTRARGARLSRGPALLVGDAAGLVDPLSGEGIHAAFLSGRLAADAARRVLDGEMSSLESYDAAMARELLPDIEMSQKLQRAFQRTPRVYVSLTRRSDRFWGAVAGFVRGTNSYSRFRRRLGPLAWAIDAVAAVSAPGVPDSGRT